MSTTDVKSRVLISDVGIHDPCRNCFSARLKLLLAAAEQCHSIIILTDGSGKIEYVNPEFTEVSGYGVEEVIGKNLCQFITTCAKNETIDGINTSLRTGSEWQGEYPKIKKNGEYYWVSTHISPMRDDTGNITNFIDVQEVITERKLAEDRLMASLKEKDVLLKEIHHRVKNNLQIVCSLLSLESGNIRDVQDKTVFLECQNRIRSMALIHETMYMSNDLTHVDLEEYVQSMFLHLLNTYTYANNITPCITVPKKVNLSVNVAIPCGLIMNELITNSIKYAFPGRGDGKITVEIGESDGIMTMSVGDDGVGLPEGFEPAEAKTLGMHLIYDLANQINGNVTIDKANGTKFIITFPLDR